jgi:predicted RNase H-like nuclease (RuvC/YqgF family)
MSLEQAQKKILQLQQSVTSMDMKIHEMKNRLKDIDFFLEHGSDYDDDALRKERVNLASLIKAIEGVRDSESKRIQQANKELNASEQILELHGKGYVCQARGYHSWAIDSIFETGPHRGHWKTRHCELCDTSEKLGRG